MIEDVARRYEDQSTDYYLSFAKKDEKEMMSAGMDIISLKGQAATNYVEAAK